MLGVPPSLKLQRTKWLLDYWLAADGTPSFWKPELRRINWRLAVGG